MKVRIVAKEGHGNDVRIENAETGERLDLPITSVTIEIRGGELTVAHLSLLMPEVDVVGDWESITVGRMERMKDG